MIWSNGVNLHISWFLLLVIDRFWRAWFVLLKVQLPNLVLSLWIGTPPATPNLLSLSGSSLLHQLLHRAGPPYELRTATRKTELMVHFVKQQFLAATCCWRPWNNADQKTRVDERHEFSDRSFYCSSTSLAGDSGSLQFDRARGPQSQKSYHIGHRVSIITQQCARRMVTDW